MTGRCYPDSERIRHFVADKDERLRGEHRYVEVRYDDDPSPDPDTAPVDEICTTQVHLERMEDDAIWMSICGLHVWFTATRQPATRKLRIEVNCFPSSCKPRVVKSGDGKLELEDR